MASRILFVSVLLSFFLTSSDAARARQGDGGDRNSHQRRVRLDDAGNLGGRITQTSSKPLFTSQPLFQDKGPMFTSEKKFGNEGRRFPANALVSPDQNLASQNTSVERVDAKGNTLHANGLLNMGKKCQAHGCTGGPCPYCGTGFCCRKGSFRGGCDGSSGGEKDLVCTIEPVYLVPTNLGKECWNAADCRSGSCGYCGTGLCCRKGQTGDGCDGQVGGVRKHECVLSGPVPEVAPAEQPEAPEYVAETPIEGIDEAPVSPEYTSEPGEDAEAHSKEMFEKPAPEYAPEFSEEDTQPAEPEYDVEASKEGGPEEAPGAPEYVAEPPDEASHEEGESVTKAPAPAPSEGGAPAGAVPGALLVLLVMASSTYS